MEPGVVFPPVHLNLCQLGAGVELDAISSENSGVPDTPWTLSTVLNSTCPGALM